MMVFSTARSLVLFSLAIGLTLGDRAVSAQSPPANTPAEVTTAQPSPPVAPSGPAIQPRPLRNYVGIGGNIGVSGNKTGLSEGGAAIITKNDLNDWLSLRGVAVFGSNRTDNTIALTVNLPVRSRSGQVLLVPFVGGGALLSSKYNFDDFVVRGLVTGGVDLPLSRRFTATASVNVGFTDDTNIGVQIGAAYNF
ncbi:MAG: hypothetical protein ACAF41_22950 [Leptolyngbya sp. BL-A-14]